MLLQKQVVEMHITSDDNAVHHKVEVATDLTSLDQRSCPDPSHALGRIRIMAILLCETDVCVSSKKQLGG